jgi:Ricin-type beta-trefoil lectin domain
MSPQSAFAPRCLVFLTLAIAAPAHADTFLGIGGLCLDVLGSQPIAGAPVVIFPCHGGANQSWDGPLPGFVGPFKTLDELCLTAGAGGALVASTCDSSESQRFVSHLDGSLIDSLGRCAQASDTKERSPVFMASCDGSPPQVFARRAFERFAQIAFGHHGIFAASLRFHPQDPNVLYFDSPHSEGLSMPFRSIDGGRHWSPLASLGQPARIELDSCDPNLLYAGSPGRLLRSRDGGATWQALSLPPGHFPGNNGFFFSVPDECNQILIISGGTFAGPHNILFSDDAGTTWQERGSIPSALGVLKVIVLSSTDLVATTLECYVGCVPDHLVELRVSHDSGSTWSTVDHGASGGGFAYDPRDRTVFATFDQLWRGDDGGRSWTKLSPPEGASRAIIGPLPGEVVISTGFDRVFRSRDRGQSWNEVSLPNFRLRQILPDGRAFAEKYGLLYSSTDLENWTPSGSGLNIGRSFTGIIEHPKNGKLYAYGEAGILESSDRGARWRQSLGGLGEGFRAAAVDSESGDVFLGRRTLWRWNPETGQLVDLENPGPGSAVDRIFFVDRRLVWAYQTAHSRWVYGSDDFGRTARLLATEIGDIEVGPSGTIFAARGGLLLISRDRGDTWTTAEQTAQALAVDPISGQVWVRVEERLWRSDDDGHRFTEVRFPRPSARPVTPPDRVALVARGGVVALWSKWRIAISRDGGVLWRDILAPDGEFQQPVQTLTFDPLSAGRLMVGGVFGTFVGDFEIPPAEVGNPDGHILADRFRLESQHRVGDVLGVGSSQSLTSETSLISFFGAEQPELMVKVLDGSAINGHYWLFYGSSTDVSFDLVLSDWYGHKRHYHNPAGTFASQGDVLALPARGRIETAPVEPGPDSATFLLHDRFEISATWRDFSGQSGSGRGGALNDEAGTLYFFSAGNRELLVKVLDGRTINGHWWVYFGGLSNVEFQLKVRDRLTGVERIYFNPLGRFASQGDPRAFAEP